MNVVYATDGSEGAAAAGVLLANLSLTPADTIRIVTAERGGDEAGRERIFAAARATLAGTGAEIQTEACAAPPVEAILGAARDASADLLVIGSLGRTGLLQYLLGSVAERVVRHAECSVLLARPLRHGLQRVLVAVDRSPMATAVVAAAQALPLPAAAELVLATVIPPRESLAAISPTVWGGLAHELEAILQGAREEAEEHLRDLAGPLKAARRAVRAELLRGDPAGALLTEAERQESDLIVLGSHGEGGMDRWLLGSVSERVVRHAPCSVLVVHG
jgi:nucleotide-binding universal stress UspA family protein